MTLLWPLLGNAALIVLWGAFLVGAKVNGRVYYTTVLPQRIPGLALRDSQYEDSVADAGSKAWIRIRIEQEQRIAAFPKNASWGRHALLEDTGEFSLVEGTVYEGAST